MKKTHLSFFLLLISTLGFSQTDLTGGIYNHTTLEPAGNPYIVTGNVVVFEGVILTISPGVILKFNAGAGLEIRGQLIAVGTSADSIEFTSNLSSPTINSWKGINVIGTNVPTGEGGQVRMEYCIGKYADYFIDLDIAYQGPYIFRHCYFAYNIQTNKDGGLPLTLFENCSFVSNTQALGVCQFDSKVSNSYFSSNEWGVGGFQLVDSCYFINHTQAAILNNEIIRNCTAVGNATGAEIGFNAVNTFKNNLIKGNYIGVKIITSFIGYTDFYDNTICDNLLYNIQLLHFNNADLSYNCWCSTDSTFIRSMIYDGYVSTYFGLVHFTPLADDCPEMNVGTREEVKTERASISIYPNPFSSELNIELSTNEETEINIFDLNARSVLKENFTKFRQLNTDHLPSGIYIYEIKTKGKKLGMGKLIKVE